MNRTTVIFLLIAFILLSAVFAEAASKAAAKSKAAGSKAGGSKAAGSKAGGSKAGGSKAGGSKAAGSKAAGSKAAGSKAAGSKAAGSKAAAPSKATPKPTLNTRLVGMRGKKTGLVIKHIIRNVGTVPVSGIASQVTIGTKFQFYQFRNKSEKNCQFASNVVKCSWKNPLAPKDHYKMMFSAAPKGTPVKEEDNRAAAATKAAAKSKAAAKTKAAGSKAAGSKAAAKTKAAGSKAAGSKAAGSKAAGSKAAAASKAAAVSMVVDDMTGWKAVVTATGIDYPISAPLRIKPKKPLTQAM